MLTASMQNLHSMKGILRFGSYAWEKPYDSINIVTVIGGNYVTEDEMVKKNKTDIVRYEEILAAGMEQLHLPQITNHHYFGYLRGNSLLSYEYEANQLEEQVRGFYDEQIESVDPEVKHSDFMFAPEKSFWLKHDSFVK